VTLELLLISLLWPSLFLLWPLISLPLFFLHSLSSFRDSLFSHCPSVLFIVTLFLTGPWVLFLLTLILYIRPLFHCTSSCSHCPLSLLTLHFEPSLHSLFLLHYLFRSGDLCFIVNFVSLHLYFIASIVLTATSSCSLTLVSLSLDLWALQVTFVSSWQTFVLFTGTFVLLLTPLFSLLIFLFSLYTP
jgi:hypothetical protein